MDWGSVKLALHVWLREVRTSKANSFVFDIVFPVQPHMELKPNCGSEKAWVWSTPADFADEESKAELLAIRFGSAESKYSPKHC